MEQSFWQSKWDKGQIGFHRDSVNPNLVEHWAALRAEHSSRADSAAVHGPDPVAARVLVPLCGKTLDLQWLEQQGLQVLGVEFVEEAAAQYFAERGVKPNVERRGGFTCFRHGNTEIVCGDFFKLSPQVIPECNYVYDRAALVAIEPARRQEYVEQLNRLTLAQASQLVITFDHDMGSGPPFSVPELEPLYGEVWKVQSRARNSILAEEPRFEERASKMEELVWLLSR